MKKVIKEKSKNIKTVKNKKLEPKKYVQTLVEIKNQVEQSQIDAAQAINIALNKRNWLIGEIISQKQDAYDWGSNFLDKLAQDLQNIYPENRGFSAANIYRMKAFYKLYSNFRTGVRKLYDLPIFSIPWFHNIIILQKLKNTDECLWYAQKSKSEGWNRTTLESQIKKDLYKREGAAITNFKNTLKDPHSYLAQQTLKDPYIFDFIKLHDEHLEYELENSLVANVQKLLLEMGKGFALVGRQYHLEVDEKDYYIDLLFYHTKLKCYVVVELKAREFDPRDAGQINFYLSAVDDLVRDSEDKPTIGLLLCKSKKNFTAEYALRDIKKPIGISEYQTEIMKKLPKELKGSFPTIEELEMELEKNEALQKKSLKTVNAVKGKKTTKK